MVPNTSPGRFPSFPHRVTKHQPRHGPVGLGPAKVLEAR